MGLLIPQPPKESNLVSGDPVNTREIMTFKAYGHNSIIFHLSNGTTHEWVYTDNSPEAATSVRAAELQRITKELKDI